MNQPYTCDELEVTINGIDWLVMGSITRTVVGTDDDGCEIVHDIVCADNVYPIVVENGDQEVADHPLAALPVEWKIALIDAILDQMQSDAEEWDEKRANR